MAYRRPNRQGRRQDPSGPAARNYREGGQGSDRSSDRPQPGPVRRAAGAPRARPAGRIPDQSAAVGEGQTRDQRWPGAIGRAADNRRAREGARGVPRRGILDPRRESGGEESAAVQGPAVTAHDDQRIDNKAYKLPKAEAREIIAAARAAVHRSARSSARKSAAARRLRLSPRACSRRPRASSTSRLRAR